MRRNPKKSQKLPEAPGQMTLSFDELSPTGIDQSDTRLRQPQHQRAEKPPPKDGKINKPPCTEPLPTNHEESSAVHQRQSSPIRERSSISENLTSILSIVAGLGFIFRLVTDALTAPPYAFAYTILVFALIIGLVLLLEVSPGNSQVSRNLRAKLAGFVPRAKFLRWVFIVTLLAVSFLLYGGFDLYDIYRQVSFFIEFLSWYFNQTTTVGH